jgi:predicted ATP-binding protein involved in virulence
MKVKRLELKGFRGFDEIVLDFDTSPQRPTVFIGINGVGKSSILDALAILLSWFISGLKNENKKNENKKYRNIPLYSENQAQGTRPSINDFENKCDAINQSITVQYGDENDYKWSLSDSKKDDLEKDDLENLDKLTDNVRNGIRDSILTSIPIIVYYTVNRSIPNITLDVQDNYSTTLLDAYEDALAYYTSKNNDQFEYGQVVIRDRDSQKKSVLAAKSITFDSFFKWFRNIEDLENENRRDEPDYRNKKLAAVRMAIHELIPEFDNLRVRRNPLRMTVNKNTQELIIDQLSDGEKCLLAMVGDIARRLAIANPSLDDPLQGEGIVLIDEIELHLHPTWQRKIIPDLTRTFPNCQFIVTTHSPQVLSHVYSENIYILQSTPDGIIASQPESSYGRDSNQILENVMDVSAYPEEIEKELLKLFRLIDRNDLEGAKQQLKDIGTKMENRLDDPQLIKAGVVIKRKEILGK